MIVTSLPQQQSGSQGCPLLLHNDWLWLVISISTHLCAWVVNSVVVLHYYYLVLFLQSCCCVILLAAVCCRFLQVLAGSRKAKKKNPGPPVSTIGAINTSSFPTSLLYCFYCRYLFSCFQVKSLIIIMQLSDKLLLLVFTENVFQPHFSRRIETHKNSLDNQTYEYQLSTETELSEQ